ncbi:MAG TPA: GNAT family N-acetyltransferase [Thermoanaerobaculia bacterium]
MSRAKTSLRPVGAGDRDFLLRLYGGTREAELRLVPWTPEQKAEFVEMQFRAQDSYYREKFPAAQFSVIEAEGEPAGRVYVVRDDARVHILDITVLPSQRRRGIGSAVLRELQEEAASKRVPLTIYVDEASESPAIFEKLGFERASGDGVSVLMQWSGGG